MFQNNLGKYYKAYVRKYKHKQDKFIIDLIIDDISKIVSAQKSASEAKLKQKLFSKMAHEFKTPLIVIRSLITDLNDPEVKDKEKISSYINYLSEYTSFLINDIIYYSNNNDVKVHLENVDLYELINFCEGVTKSLIAVMPGNKTNVGFKVFFDPSFKVCKEELAVRSDKTRLK